MEIRSFLAFELPAEMKSILSRVSEDMRPFLRDVKWIKVENIHLTIVFLGNMQTEKLTTIAESVETVCRIYGAFDITLKGTGFFGSKRNPRVLWAGLDGDTERMASFRDALQLHLKPFGIKEENRKFRPHLTLGRFKKYARPDNGLEEALSRHGALSSPVYTLETLALFRSDLKPDGAVYSRLNTWALLGHT